MTIPPVITYQSANAPASERWIGFFRINGERMPVFISGATEDIVIERAEAFWRKHATASPSEKRSDKTGKRVMSEKKAAALAKARLARWGAKKL